MRAIRLIAFGVMLMLCGMGVWACSVSGLRSVAVDRFIRLTEPYCFEAFVVGAGLVVAGWAWRVRS
jgi:hypothetical protein